MRWSFVWTALFAFLLTIPGWAEENVTTPAETMVESQEVASEDAREESVQEWPRKWPQAVVTNVNVDVRTWVHVSPTAPEKQPVVEGVSAQGTSTIADLTKLVEATAKLSEKSGPVVVTNINVAVSTSVYAPPRPRHKLKTPGESAPDDKQDGETIEEPLNTNRTEESYEFVLSKLGLEQGLELAFTGTLNSEEQARSLAKRIQMRAAAGANQVTLLPMFLPVPVESVLTLQHAIGSIKAIDQGTQVIVSAQFPKKTCGALYDLLVAGIERILN